MAASELVNLSLDDIIARQNKLKKYGNTQRGRNRGARGGGAVRNGFRGFQIPAIGNSVQRQKYVGQSGPRFNNEKLCTVHISNLAPTVTTRDLQELFAQHPFIDIAVHYDQYGISRGTAVVLFRRFDEAMQLKTQFTGVKLDGRLMELYAMSNVSSVSSNRGFPHASEFAVQKGRVTKFVNRRKPENFSFRKLGSGNSLGRFRGSKSNRGGVLGNRRIKMTAEDLDKELEKYMRSAKHTPIVAP